MTLLRNDQSLKKSFLSGRTAYTASVEQLYDECAALVYSIITKFIEDKIQAEEILAEVFVHLYKDLSNYDAARGSFVVWLINTTRNLALDKLCAMQTDYQCNENFKNLPLAQKTVFALYYFRSYSITEIAEILHLPTHMCEKLLKAAEEKQSR